jgi:hypothetical protein
LPANIWLPLIMRVRRLLGVLSMKLNVGCRSVVPQHRLGYLEVLGNGGQRTKNRGIDGVSLCRSVGRLHEKPLGRALGV